MVNPETKLFFTSAGFVIISTSLLIAVLTVLFLLYPEDTAKAVGYQTKTQPRLAKGTDSQVLGVSTATKGQVLGVLLKPFSNLSLEIVKLVDPKAYKRAVPDKIIDADFVQGRSPGATEGDLAVVGKDGTIEGLNLKIATPSVGLTLTDSCDDDQILSWDGTDWVCSNQTGAISSLNSLTGALKIAGAGIAAVSASSSTITLTATEADTLSSVVGRGATTTTAVTFGALDTTGNVGLGKSLTVTGLTLANGGLNVSGLSNLTGNLNVGGATTLSGALTVNNSSIALNLGSDATGDVFYRNSSGTLSKLGIGSAGQALVVSSGLPAWGTGSQWTTSSPNIYFLGTTGAGNVGIGNTYANWAKLQLTGSGTGTGITFQTLDSAGTQRFSILDNGNVGIGTTNPGSALSVIGNVGIGTSNTLGNNLTVVGSANFTGNVGIGWSSPDRLTQLASDINITPTLASLTAAAGTQFAVTGSSATGLQKKLVFGIDTTDNFGIIQALSGSGGSSSDWYSSSWSYRKQITIDNTKVDADLTNFPVLVNLSSDSNLASNAQSDGDDILFTSSNGTTKLDHEIEIYTSATGALVAWVEVSSLVN